MQQYYAVWGQGLRAVSLEVAFQAGHEGSEAPEGLGFIPHDVQDGRRQIRHALHHQDTL